MKTSKPRGRKIAPAYTPQDDDTLLSELVARNFWDCVSLSNRFQQSKSIFDNSNIGRLDLTNLQVPGSVTPRGGAFVCTNWYARTNIPLEREDLGDLFGLFAQHTIVSLQVGDKRSWVMPLSDLMRSWRDPGAGGEASQRVVRPVWPLAVHHGQYVKAYVDAFSSGAGYYPDLLVSRLASEYGPAAGLDCRVYVHLEGVELPPYHSNEGGEDALDDQAHWRNLIGRVMRLVTRGEKNVTDTAEHIARWIGVLAAEATDQASAAQLHAISDGVREQRFRPPPRIT